MRANQVQILFYFILYEFGEIETGEFLSGLGIPQVLAILPLQNLISKKFDHGWLLPLLKYQQRGLEVITMRLIRR